MKNNPKCPACGQVLWVLGRLGNLVHYRCYGCGVDSSKPVKKKRRVKR